MMQFFGQMMKLPLEAFVYSMVMFVKTMEGIQRIANQGIDMMAEGSKQSPVDALGSETGSISDVTDSALEESADTTHQEETKMSNRDLGGDDLKLVRYKILFIKRDYEHAFPEREELVYENTDASAFTAWKVAEFIQQLQHDPQGIRIPEKWRSHNYPPDERRYRIGNDLKGLPDDDKKYLRVYYEVLDRYPREPLKYEEDQLRVLREIRDRIPSGPGSTSSVSK